MATEETTETKEAVKLKKGARDEMETSADRKPKLEFEVNKTARVVFSLDFVKPKEYGNEKDGIWYIFPVFHEEVDKVIMTSAWTLLRGLKVHMPLAGKILDITKKMKGSKQEFEVVEFQPQNMALQIKA